MMMSESEARDRVEIRSMMDSYAIAVDLDDWDLLRTLFTGDSLIDYTDVGGPRGDLETLIAWLGRGSTRYAARHANMTTHHCQIDGDTAKAVTYFLAFRTTIDGAGEALMGLGGFFRDRLVKTSEGWRISERQDVFVWLPSPLPERLNPPPNWYGTLNHHRPTLFN